jgi:hypothetical protein
MKAKSSILTVVLSLFLASGLLAQEKSITEKYEYATVRGNWGGNCINSKVIFTIAGNQEIVSSTVKDGEKDLLKKVNDLSNEGWEVYNNTALEGSCAYATYYLRKKKN